MKKFLSAILTFIMCFAVCFAFVGCDTEFYGNFSKEATSEQAMELLEWADDAIISTENVKGIQLESKISSKYYSEVYTAQSNFKINFEKEQALFDYKQTDYSTDSDFNINVNHHNIYIKDNVKYVDSSYDDMSEPYKFDFTENFYYTVLNYLYNEEQFNLLGLISEVLFESIDEDTLSEKIARVYIDENVNTKLKIVFDKNENSEELFSGSIIMVFNNAYNVTALNCDISYKDYYDGEEYKIFAKITSFDGTINIPADAKTWEDISY